VVVTDGSKADWELCNRTCKRLIELYGSDARATDIPQKERTVVLVWTVHGIVGNGGFEALFSGDLPGDPGYQLALDAFRVIGCEVAATAFEDALAVFPRGRVPKDEAKRKAAFVAHGEKDRDLLASRFFRAATDIESRLAAYIRQHHLVERGH
jgi:Domain of unknown function (DUF4375)